MPETLEQLEARLQRAWTASATPDAYAAAKAAACRPTPAAVPVLADARGMTDDEYQDQCRRLGYRRRAY